MTESWFHRLEDDVRHAAGHFRHDGPSISGEQKQPATPLEPAMPLADTAATLDASHTSALAELRDLLVKGHDVVDNHMTQIRAGIDDVAAVASIADTPLVVAAAGALHCPPEVLEGFVSGLTAIARAFPKPQPAQPAAEVPAEPAQPEAGQPAEQSAA